MALTEAEIQGVAKGVQDVARLIKKAKVALDSVLSTNTAHAINWASTEAQDALENNASPTNSEAAEISNAIGSFATFNTSFWEAGHGGNLEKLLGTEPIV